MLSVTKGCCTISHCNSTGRQQTATVNCNLHGMHQLICKLSPTTLQALVKLCPINRKLRTFAFKVKVKLKRHNFYFEDKISQYLVYVPHVCYCGSVAIIRSNTLAALLLPPDKLVSYMKTTGDCQTPMQSQTGFWCSTPQQQLAIFSPATDVCITSNMVDNSQATCAHACTHLYQWHGTQRSSRTKYTVLDGTQEHSRTQHNYKRRGRMSI